MKTIPEIINEVAAEFYPGTSFAPEIKNNAVAIIETDARALALKALRKAIVRYRPATPKEVARPNAQSRILAPLTQSKNT